MGSNRSVPGLTLPLLALTVVPSALVSAGATRAGCNSDGWPDLLVCGETGGLHLFDNDQGQGFTDVSSFLGAQVNAVDVAMVDVNHDSRPDLITLTGTKVAERLQLAVATPLQQPGT
jgi:VCBS repeat protein